MFPLYYRLIDLKHSMALFLLQNELNHLEHGHTTYTVYKAATERGGVKQTRNLEKLSSDCSG